MRSVFTLCLVTLAIWLGAAPTSRILPLETPVSATDSSVSPAAATVRPRQGLVRLDGRALRDDGGLFTGLGASLMWAAWGYKFDRARLEATLRFLADHKFDYIRALGVVGSASETESWDGREIDWRWPDYAAVIAGVTDLAYDRYGLRVQWTLIGDGQLNTPRHEDRLALVRTFVEMARTRPHKIMHFEIANEGWQNGFEGDAGLTRLRELTVSMREQLRAAGTPILVAASAPAGVDCASYQKVYAGGIADLATIHFDRDVDKAGGRWRPVWQPWALQQCPGLPVASNNEPIGPGSSVAADHDPYRIVAAMIATYMAGLPLYVYHTDAGVYGREDLWDVTNGEVIVDGLAAMKALLPSDLPNWNRQDPGAAEHPFTGFDGGAESARGEKGAGALRVLASTRGPSSIVLPLGIDRTLRLDARDAIRVEMFDVLSGLPAGARSLAPGERLEVAGYPVVLLRGQR